MVGVSERERRSCAGAGYEALRGMDLMEYMESEHKGSWSEPGRATFHELLAPLNANLCLESKSFKVVT